MLRFQTILYGPVFWYVISECKISLFIGQKSLVKFQSVKSINHSNQVSVRPLILDFR